MWFTSFALAIDDRVDSLVHYEWLGVPYRYPVRDYKQPRHRSASTTSIPIIQTMMISQDEASVDKSDTVSDNPLDPAHQPYNNSPPPPIRSPNPVKAPPSNLQNLSDVHSP